MIKNISVIGNVAIHITPPPFPIFVFSNSLKMIDFKRSIQKPEINEADHDHFITYFHLDMSTISLS